MQYAEWVSHINDNNIPCSWKQSYRFVFSERRKAAHTKHWTSLINPDLRCGTKLTVLKTRKQNSILWECTKKIKWISECLSSCRKGTHHLRPRETTKTWKKKRSQSWNGATGPWPQAPSLTEVCCQCQRYWGTQHPEQFSACPGQPGGFPSCLKSRRQGGKAERIGIAQPGKEKHWGGLIVAF